MNLETLKTKLETLPLGGVRYFDQIGSTNDEAARWLDYGAPDLALVVADAQTAGRGQHGRKWFTQPGTALAFSVILKEFPGMDETIGGISSNLELVARVTALGAIGVAEALRNDYGIHAQIKWPNDVLLDEKKTCGVLAEAHWEGNHLQAVVLGIGVNVAPQSVPDAENLNFPATCVEYHTNKSVNRLELLRTILAKALEDRMRISTPTFIQDWEKRLAFMGEQVYIVENEKSICQGVVSGLDASGRLILQLEDSRMKALTTGEIHLRPFVDR